MRKNNTFATMKTLLVSGYALLIWGMIPLVLTSTFTSCGKLEELLNGGEDEEENGGDSGNYYDVFTNDGAAPYFELESTSIQLPAVRNEEGMQVKYKTNIANMRYILEKYKKYTEGELPPTDVYPSFLLEYPEGDFYASDTPAVSYLTNYTAEKQTDNLLIYATDNDSLLATIPIEQEVGASVSVAQTETTTNSITLTLEGQHDATCYAAIISQDTIPLSDIINGIRYGAPLAEEIYSLQDQPSITFSDLTEATKYYIYLQGGTDQKAMCGISQYTVTTSMRGIEDALIMEYKLSALNNRTVYLPFEGHVRGVIDWGDGTTETIGDQYVTSATLSHAYGEGTSSTTSVTFKGTVEALTTSGYSAQIEVLKASLLGITQWGNPELQKINLQGAIALNYLAADTKGALANVTDFNHCFYGCTSLTSLPEGLFAKATRATNFSYAFGDCTGLTSLPSDLFAQNAEATLFTGTFYQCTSLETLPATLFAGAVKAGVFNMAFYGCSSLTALPEGLFDQNANVSEISQAFSHCTKLQQIPVSLFDHMRMLQTTNEMFFNCTSLTGESPYTVINGSKVHLYERQNYPSEFLKIDNHSNTYTNCTGLSDYGSIPDEWK